MITLEERRRQTRPSYTPAEVQTYKEDLRRYKDEVRSGDWTRKPFDEFLSIVTQRPDPTLAPGQPVCPYCHSVDIAREVAVSTCLGHSDDYDPNHHWTECRCRHCNSTWTMEHKGIIPSQRRDGRKSNVWYTSGDRHGETPPRILRGIPTCFESYTYTCSTCGGDVVREYVRNGTRERVTILSSRLDGSGRDYETWFSCLGCNRTVQSSTDSYLGFNPFQPRRPFRPRLRLGWHIDEKPGIAIISDYAFSSITS